MKTDTLTTKPETPAGLSSSDLLDGMVSWHRTQENIWCADDGQSFVVYEDDGNWYAYLDDGSNRRRGPFGSAKQAIAYAS